ncbi:MAG TPA: COX15/CtaA family protein [Nevskiaceae bacterium]
MSGASPALRTLAWVACIFTFVLVAFGAFVRLSDAGLSCPDWPTCYGQITWPSAPAAVARADRAFPARPVEVHRAWREQIHRFLAGTLGVLVLIEALAATFATKRRLALTVLGVVLIGIGIPLYTEHAYLTSSVIAGVGEVLLLALAVFWDRGGWRRIAVLALALVCFQALLGMWTVTLLLLPVVVTAHLRGGMATLGLLAWLAWRLSIRRFPPARSRALVAATIVGLVLLSGQIFLGGWTSTNYAGLACGTGHAAFPECLGQWWPAMNFRAGFVLTRHIGVDYQGGVLDAAARTAIQVMHRLGALIVLLYCLWLGYCTARRGLRGHGAAVALVVVAQVGLGIANVTLGLPLWVAEAHTVGAALLLVVLVSLLVRVACAPLGSGAVSGEGVVAQAG